MGLKFFYYMDISANWVLFIIGIICVPFGIGGLLLTTPIKKIYVTIPWYHGTGLWLGTILIITVIIIPLSRYHLKLSIFITFVAMIISSVGLGVEIDEYSNWFENPNVKTFGSDISGLDTDEYVFPNAEHVVYSFAQFTAFHKTRVIVIMIGALLGIFLLLFRIIILDLMVFDEFITYGFDVLTPEEEMVNQVWKKELSSNDSSLSPNYKILKAGVNKGINEKDLNLINKNPKNEGFKEKLKNNNYFENIKSREGELESIYDLSELPITKGKLKVQSEPTYTNGRGNFINDNLEIKT